MPHCLHEGRGALPSSKIITLSFGCLYAKCFSRCTQEVVHYVHGQLTHLILPGKLTGYDCPVSYIDTQSGHECRMSGFTEQQYCSLTTSTCNSVLWDKLRMHSENCDILDSFTILATILNFYWNSVEIHLALIMNGFHFWSCPWCHDPELLLSLCRNSWTAWTSCRLKWLNKMVRWPNFYMDSL